MCRPPLSAVDPCTGPPRPCWLAPMAGMGDACHPPPRKVGIRWQVSPPPPVPAELATKTLGPLCSHRVGIACYRQSALPGGWPQRVYSANCTRKKLASPESAAASFPGGGGWRFRLDTRSLVWVNLGNRGFVGGENMCGGIPQPVRHGVLRSEQFQSMVGE